MSKTTEFTVTELKAMGRKTRNARLARAVRSLLKKEDMWKYTQIYFNGKCYNGEETTERLASDVCDYTNDDQTIVVIFDGGKLYDIMNYGYNYSVYAKMEKLFKKYGYCWELGNSWNLCAYDIYDIPVETPELSETGFDWEAFGKACDEAREAGAAAALSVADDGSCNFDACFVEVGISPAKAEQFVKARGIFGYAWKWCGKDGLLMTVRESGQAYTRTKAAEAMSAVFKAHGYSTMVYYRLD